MLQPSFGEGRQLLAEGELLGHEVGSSSEEGDERGDDERELEEHFEPMAASATERLQEAAQSKEKAQVKNRQRRALDGRRPILTSR